MPLGALVALGGAPPAATLPLLAASMAVFFASGARVAARAETRALDLALVAFTLAIVFQMLPLPGDMVASLSPHAWPVQRMLELQPVAESRPLSIDARLTRSGLATVASALLIFWAAREAFSRGGLRTTARAIAWAGGAVALAGLAARVTAPHLLLWKWVPADAGAQPFGPFVNRNHFAMWLLLAGSVTAGYLVAHLRAHDLDELPSTRLVIRDLLADGAALLVGGALAVMALALAATLSRAALLGAGAAIACAWICAPRRDTRDLTLTVAGLIVVTLLAGALWVNRQRLAGRLEGRQGTEISRPVIWAETVPLVRDFWATGTGLGTYGRAMLRYQRTRPETLFNQAHSEYLQLAAEGGLLLLLPAAAALWLWLRLARRRLAEDTHELQWIRIGAAAGLCGIAVQNLFEVGLRMPANALLVALLAAIVVHEPRTLAVTDNRAA